MASDSRERWIWGAGTDSRDESTQIPSSVCALYGNPPIRLTWGFQAHVSEPGWLWEI
jgi:hypothetical protein